LEVAAVGAKLNSIDNPGVVNGALSVLVAFHAIATYFGLPNVWAPFQDASKGDQAGVYVGFLGATAVVSGFAGVVVVFGLSGTSEKFRKFRILGGKSLTRNWISTSSSALLASALALGAAIALYSGGGWLSPWLFEFGIVLIAHSSVRLLLLLRGLVGIVAADDVIKERAASKKSASDAPWNNTSQGRRAS
jgi:hypothetical protein